jgi:hypothetical protein
MAFLLPAASRAAAKFPWKTLISVLPQVTQAAASAYAQWASRPKPEPVDITATTAAQIAEISQRIQALEANEKDQAEVVAQIAEQLQGIAFGLKETAARQSVVLWLGGGALAVSLCALVAAMLV